MLILPRNGDITKSTATVRNGLFTYETGPLGLVFRYNSKGVQRVKPADVPDDVYSRLYGRPKPLARGS